MMERKASLLARARERYAEGGLSDVWWRALRWIGVYRTFLFMGGPNQPFQEPPPSIAIACEELGSDGIEAYLKLRPDQTREEIDRRFRGGDRCFVGRCEGRIVTSAWIACESAWLPFVPCRIGLAERTFYTYDIFVVAELRGKRVANALMDYRAARMREAGYDRKVSIVEPENRSSLRRNVRRHIPEVSRLTCLRIGPWRRLRIRPAAADVDPLVKLA